MSCGRAQHSGGPRACSPGKIFKMDSLRHILAHSQPNIMMGRLFTRTPSQQLYRRSLFLELVMSCLPTLTTNVS